MFLFRKKAFITDWWLARRKDELKFVDIINKEALTKECVVVGRIGEPTTEFVTSLHNVIKVTRRGVYTSSGRFYPLKTAHPLYLKFLYEVNIPPGGIVASKWSCIDAKKDLYVANLEYPSGEISTDVVFDFQMLTTRYGVFVGTSDMLDDIIVFNTFDRRELLNRRKDIRIFSSDAYRLAYYLACSKKKYLRRLKKLLRGIRR